MPSASGYSCRLFPAEPTICGDNMPIFGSEYAISCSNSHVLGCRNRTSSPQYSMSLSASAACHAMLAFPGLLKTGGPCILVHIILVGIVIELPSLTNTFGIVGRYLLVLSTNTYLLYQRYSLGMAVQSQCPPV